MHEIVAALALPCGGRSLFGCLPGSLTEWANGLMQYLWLHMHEGQM